MPEREDEREREGSRRNNKKVGKIDKEMKGIKKCT